MKSWQLQTAKARFSEMVKSAIQEGPQAITVRGQTAVVVLSKPEYDRLSQRKTSFVDFMRSSPLVGIELNLQRDSSNPREIDL